MRILFSSTKGTGHLTPLLPYLNRLRERGHEVKVAAPHHLAQTLRKSGIAHAEFGYPEESALDAIWATMAGLTRDQINAIAIKRCFAGLYAEHALPGLLETIRHWTPDLVVRESVEFASLLAAEALEVPHARVAVHNGASEEKFQPLACDPLQALCQQSGVATDIERVLLTESIFTAFPEVIDGNAAKARGQPLMRVRPPAQPALSGPVPDWLPTDGRTPVYMTFGTVAGADEVERAVYRAALAAVDGLPLQALLTTGPRMEADTLGPVPSNVVVRAWVPQADVFPRVAAMICHGGSGTMLGGLAAGLPMVIAPMFADQPDNAALIDAAGAGIAVPDPDATRLRMAIERVLTDDDLRLNALRISEEMAVMSTLDDAVDAMLALVR